VTIHSKRFDPRAAVLFTEKDGLTWNFVRRVRGFFVKSWSMAAKDAHEVTWCRIQRLSAAFES
jgi:hypothetical protein